MSQNQTSPSNQEPKSEKPTPEQEISVLKNIVAMQGQEIDTLSKQVEQLAKQFSELINALNTAFKRAESSPPNPQGSSSGFAEFIAFLNALSGGGKPSTLERLTIAIMQNTLLQQVILNRAIAKKLGVEVSEAVFRSIEELGGVKEEEK
jgi:uncharacterized coiled-coil protein SlyX